MGSVILLLDDEDAIRRDLVNRLRLRGYGVHAAESAENAKKIILSERIDCAIVDLKIDWQSEFGGAEVINFLKRNQPRALAVVLSAYALDERIISQLEVEIDGYVEKGGPENYITAVIAKIVQLAKQAPPKKCFVIMPFSASKSCTQKEWDEVVNKLIKPAVERSGFAQVDLPLEYSQSPKPPVEAGFCILHSSFCLQYLLVGMVVSKRDTRTEGTLLRYRGCTVVPPYHHRSNTLAGRCVHFCPQDRLRFRCRSQPPRCRGAPDGVIQAK